MGSNFWGRCTPIVEPFLVGDWDVHCGYGILTHGQVKKKMKDQQRPACAILQPLKGHGLGQLQWRLVHSGRLARILLEQFGVPLRGVRSSLAAICSVMGSQFGRSPTCG